MFRHRYRYWFVLVLSLYTYLNTILCSVYYYFKIDIEWYYAIATIFLCTLLTWEGNRLVEPLLQKKLPPANNKIRFLLSFFIAGNIIALVAAFVPVYFIGNIIHQYSWSENSNPLKLNVIYTSLVNLFFHLLNAIFFFFREYQRQWIEAEELKRNSAQAQVQLVKSQINPHFLFNSLNVLSGMVIKDHPDANHFIEEFSKVYRYILNNQEKELVQLNSELDFIHPYIFLLNKRFDEGLTVEIDIPDQYRNYYVIPVALQMLIENAIKHNIVSRNKPLHIKIQANGNQTLVVKNNLQLRKVPEVSTRIGLQNICTRYELISGKKVIVSQTDHSFEVTIPLLNLN
ncbi:MAG: sensor histidine kinase [Chitinophagaceae bacterium]